MAPTVAKHLSCPQNAAKTSVKGKGAQSKIPVRNLFTIKTASNIENKKLLLPTRTILRPKQPTYGKSVDGKTNILKPVIKKKISPIKDITWTKRTTNLASKRKSIEKAKDIRIRKNLQQRTLPKAFFKKVETTKDVKNQGKKENTLPTITVSSLVNDSSNDFSSLKAAQDKLNNTPSEFYRNQTLNNEPLSFSQLKDSTPSKRTSAVSQKLNKLKASPSFFKLERPSSFLERPKSAIAKKLERLALSPKSRSAIKYKAFDEKSWQIPDTKLWTSISLDTQSFNKKVNRNLFGTKCNTKIQSTNDKSQLSSNMAPRFTWTSEQFSANKHLVKENLSRCSDKKLETKKTLTTKSKSCAVLFNSEKKIKEDSSSLYRRVTWAPGTQENSSTKASETKDVLRKLKERRSKLLANPKIFKSSELDFLSSKVKLNKVEDTYEMAMDQIRELKRKTPMDALSVSKKPTPSKFGFSGKLHQNSDKKSTKKCVSSSKQTAKKENFEELADVSKSVVSSSPLKVTDEMEKLSIGGTFTPNQQTPRRVRFDFECPPSSVYRPLKTFFTRSILKKQPRLTDISECSENESLRFSDAAQDNKKHSTGLTSVLLKNHVSPLSDSPPLFAPKAIHPFKSLQWDSSESFLIVSDSAVTPIRDLPIHTPLAMKNITRNHENQEFLEPVKQQLFDDQSLCTHQSLYSHVFIKSKLDDVSADEECAKLLAYPIIADYSRQLLNPIAKILNEGDEQHFVPVRESLVF